MAEGANQKRVHFSRMDSLPTEVVACARQLESIWRSSVRFTLLVEINSFITVEINKAAHNLKNMKDVTSYYLFKSTFKFSCLIIHIISTLLHDYKMAKRVLSMHSIFHYPISNKIN